MQFIFAIANSSIKHAVPLLGWARPLFALLAALSVYAWIYLRAIAADGGGASSAGWHRVQCGTAATIRV